MAAPLKSVNPPARLAAAASVMMLAFR